MDNLNNYLKIKEAAEFLGVSPSTLRNWDKSGKIPTYRQPINGYRLFKRSDLEAFLREVELSGKLKQA